MINCLNVSESTAWDCRVLDSRGTLELCPPVTFADGAIIPVYVIPAGEGSVEITDDGGFKEHLSRCGLKAALDSRRLGTLEKTVANWGVGFDDALSIVSKNESLSFSFQRYLGALFDAARWELEVLNLPPDNTAPEAKADYDEFMAVADALAALSTAAQQPERVPLTSLQISEGIVACGCGIGGGQFPEIAFSRGVRWAEKHHGIKPKDQSND